MVFYNDGSRLRAREEYYSCKREEALHLKRAIKSSSRPWVKAVASLSASCRSLYSSSILSRKEIARGSWKAFQYKKCYVDITRAFFAAGNTNAFVSISRSFFFLLDTLCREVIVVDVAFYVDGSWDFTWIIKRRFHCIFL